MYTFSHTIVYIQTSIYIQASLSVYVSFFLITIIILQAIQVELQKTLKKKERVDKEEREMYKRMVEGVPEKKGQTSTRKKGSTRQEKWVSIHVCT